MCSEEISVKGYQLKCQNEHCDGNHVTHFREVKKRRGKEITRIYRVTWGEPVRVCPECSIPSPPYRFKTPSNGPDMCPMCLMILS